MVVIRLARGGSKKNPFYHVVATDKRNSRDGRFIERLGYFNPVAHGQAKTLELNQERIDYWISKGAQPSDRVTNILKEFKKTGGDIKAELSRSVLRAAQAEQTLAAQAKKLAEEKAKAEEEAKAEAEAAKKAEAEAKAAAPAEEAKPAEDESAAKE